MQKQLSIRLSLETVADLEALADATHLSVTGVLRGALRYVLMHPEALAETMLSTEDMRTPEQIRSWEQNFARLTDRSHIDQLIAEQQEALNSLLADHRRRPRERRDQADFELVLRLRGCERQRRHCGDEETDTLHVIPLFWAFVGLPYA